MYIVEFKRERRRKARFANGRAAFIDFDKRGVRFSFDILSPAPDFRQNGAGSVRFSFKISFSVDV